MNGVQAEERREEPLLLNPCKDKPEDYLEFTTDGVVRAKAGAVRQKGETSIEVYALNRSGLVNTRQEVLRLLQARIRTINLLIELLDKNPADDIADLAEDLLSHEMAELNKFREPTMPYCLMCRQVVDEFLQSFA